MFCIVWYWQRCTMWYAVLVITCRGLYAGEAQQCPACSRNSWKRSSQHSHHVLCTSLLFLVRHSVYKGPCYLTASSLQSIWCTPYIHRCLWLQLRSTYTMYVRYNLCSTLMISWTPLWSSRPSVPLINFSHVLISMCAERYCCLRAVHTSLSTVMAQRVGTGTLQCSSPGGVCVLITHTTCRHVAEWALFLGISELVKG